MVYDYNVHTTVEFVQIAHESLTFHIQLTAMMSVYQIDVANHYGDVIMGAMASQITSLTIVY